MVWTMKASIRGPEGQQGEPGQNVSLRVNGSNIEWRIGTGTWNVLVPLTSITGPRGEDGTSVTIKGSVPTSEDLDLVGPHESGDGYITQDDGHLHVWDGDSFNDVGTVRGPAGADGAPGVDGLDGDNGLSVELRTNAGNVEWRQTGGAWQTLVPLSTITGPAGTDGTDGVDGQEVELQKTSTEIQWRLGTGPWISLVTLASIKGDKGDQGNQGIQGIQGVRGAKWFTGSGAPGTLAGAQTGDFYLDTASGTVYELEV